MLNSPFKLRKDNRSDLLHANRQFGWKNACNEIFNTQIKGNILPET